MRPNAYLSPTVLALLILASPCTRAAGTDEATKAFNALYRADLARVRGTGDTRDDVELAVRLLAAAKRAADQPAFLTVLCEKACDLGLAHPTGYPTALKAMDFLAQTIPQKAADCAARTLEVRQKQYDAAQGDEKKVAGELLLGSLLPLIEAKEQAGALAEAAALYRKARTIAAATGSPRADEIDARAETLAQQMKTAARIADVKALLARDPANVKAREGLVRLYLVDLDDPAEAAVHLNGAEDTALLKYVPAAAKGLEAAPEFACLELGEWYRDLAAKAPSHAKAATYARAKAYLERFLTLYTSKDLSRTRATLALQKVQEALAGLAGPAAPDKSKWIDLIALLDPAKDAVLGQWQRQGGALVIVNPVRNGRIVFPLVVAGDYELRARFVRTSGDNAVVLVLPVGSTAVCLNFSSHHGSAIGLEYINRQNAHSNETSVKPSPIVNGREYEVHVRVGVEGDEARIAVALNGQPCINWRGPVSALSMVGGWRLPRHDCPGLATWETTVAFRTVSLKMLSGEARLLRPEGE